MKSLLNQNSTGEMFKSDTHCTHIGSAHETGYSLVPKESNVTLVPHITLIRPNTLSLEGAITLFWVNTKRKTVMTLIRIALLRNGSAVTTTLVLLSFGFI